MRANSLCRELSAFGLRLHTCACMTVCVMECMRVKCVRLRKWESTKQMEREREREKHSATYCKALQHTAMHCNTLQHSATVLMPSALRAKKYGQRLCVRVGV